MGRLAWGQIQAGPQGGTWVHPCTGSPGGGDAVHSGGIRQTAIASEEGGAVGRIRIDGPAHGGEGDPASVVRVEAVARQQRLCLFVPLGDRVQLGRFAVFSERPLGVTRDREAPRAAGVVLETQALELHRLASLVVDRHQDRQLLLDAVAVVLEDGVACAVTRAVRVCLADRQGRRRPVVPRLLVAQIDGLRWWIEHRVIRPRCQPVALTVAVPGEAGAGLADERAEGGIGDHVDPRRRV